jgi:uncharacterized protein (UPF0276 family)
VSAANHSFDAHRYLRAIPSDAVQEIHLAGFTRNRFEDGEILIDTHNRRVDQAVWRLYTDAIDRLGPTPTLIEWDVDLPALPVLIDEARIAQGVLDSIHAFAA